MQSYSGLTSSAAFGVSAWAARSRDGQWRVEKGGLAFVQLPGVVSRKGAVAHDVAKHVESGSQFFFVAWEVNGPVGASMKQDQTSRLVRSARLSGRHADAAGNTAGHRRPGGHAGTAALGGWRADPRASAACWCL